MGSQPGTGASRPAGARPRAPRLPRDLARARRMLVKAVEDAQAGRISGRRAEAIVRAAAVLVRLAERRMAAREREPKRAPVITLQPWAQGGPDEASDG